MWDPDHVVGVIGVFCCWMRGDSTDLLGLVSGIHYLHPRIRPTGRLHFAPFPTIMISRFCVLSETAYMSTLLSSIQSPADLRKIPLDQLPALAREMRELIMTTVGANGGHLAPNLGTVEICLALNIVFKFPQDRLLWDVGHQCYPHKLLTGRAKHFASLRKKGGICGFPDPSESPYDLFAVGHAGTGISTAVGMARADFLSKRNSRVAVLVGDASIVNGLAFEGLNNAGTLKRQMLIILNDNSMSISEPQGAFANYLEHLRVTTTYDEVKKRVQHLLEQIPYGQQISDVAYHVKQGIKNTIAPGHIFEDLGLKYFGPVDGHDIPTLLEKLNELKDLNAPAVLHIKTVKGKGYEWACEDPTTFHSPKPYRVEGCRVVLEKGNGRSWTAAFADAMVNLARKNDKVCGITAAMPDGTGMIKLKPAFPDRYFDTGICESHATAMAAGMTKAGLRPIVAIYSTFLQRAFDQIFQEVCLQGLPVIFCADRAGLVGDDGAVHHGFCDLAFLRSQPGMVLMSPSDERDPTVRSTSPPPSIPPRRSATPATTARPNPSAKMSPGPSQKPAASRARSRPALMPRSSPMAPSPGRASKPPSFWRMKTSTSA